MVLAYALDIGKLGLLCVGVGVVFYYLYGLFLKTSSKVLSSLGRVLRFVIELELFAFSALVLFVALTETKQHGSWSWTQILLMCLAAWVVFRSFTLLLPRVAERIRGKVFKDSQSYSQIIQNDARGVACFIVVQLLLIALDAHHLWEQTHREWMLFKKIIQLLLGIQGLVLIGMFVWAIFLVFLRKARTTDLLYLMCCLCALGAGIYFGWPHFLYHISWGVVLGYLLLFLVLSYDFGRAIKFKVKLKPFFQNIQNLKEAKTLYLTAHELYLEPKNEKYADLADMLTQDLLTYAFSHEKIMTLEVPTKEGGHTICIYRNTLGLLARATEIAVSWESKSSAEEILTRLSNTNCLAKALDELEQDSYLAQAEEKSVGLGELQTILADYKQAPTQFMDTLMAYVPNLNFGQYVLDGKYNYMPFSSLEAYDICDSCGKLVPKKDPHMGEFFCSQECRMTESLCEGISESLSPYMPEEQGLEDYYASLESETEERIAHVHAQLEMLASVVETIEVAQNWVELYKPLSNPKTGHGWMAEILNNRIDVKAGKDAQIVGGDNAKGGADRLVDGMEVQSKYYESAEKSLDAYFYSKDSQGNEIVYLDRNGKPMSLEIPKDQYDEALKLIDEGKYDEKLAKMGTTKEEFKEDLIPGVSTQEAKNTAKFFTKESLEFDSERAGIVARTSLGVSFVCNTALLLLRGDDVKDALKSALLASMLNASKSFVVSIMAMQAQRIGALDNLLKSVINFDFKGNRIGRGLAQISGAGKGISQNAAANTVLRSSVVTAGVTIILNSGMEVIQLARGKISGMQCFKNIMVGGVQVVGATAGALAGAAMTGFVTGATSGSVIPVLGTIVGGLAGGIAGLALGQKLTSSIQEDRVRVYTLFFGHIQYLALLFKMNKQEMEAFSKMIEATIAEHGEETFFKKISPSANRTLPHINAILKPMAVIVVSARPKIPPAIFNSLYAKQAEAELFEDL
ncbi:hypothetical protein [Helicobacter ailurogastricus]|uniref:hypothetical protein n=1 Tax=Helicobacter ailurogastricus TaxID=1578720 RepID=UPI000CF0EF53|nr:hypothetical protein [Helicobacter ailurogastricus]